MGVDGRVSPQPPEELLGSTLGTCTLERILGRGGMGVVFLAQQSRPRRQVAVKVLLLSSLADAHRRGRFLERFRREADAVAALEHPNILPIFEYGEQADLAYLVMPYVPGGTLRDRVIRKGPLPLLEASSFVAQAAAALDYSHARGVIHRDVKPHNMLLYPDKRLVLSDFGIAKLAQAAAEEGGKASDLTTLGRVVGTPDYMSPEQAMGKQVDARTDIYSLGVVLYYLVTGRLPFVAPQPVAVVAKHVSEAPPPPRQFRPDLPAAAEAVILRALAKDPDARYRTAGELARAYRATLPSVTLPVEPAERRPTANPPPAAPVPGNAPPAAPFPATPKKTERPAERPPERPAGQPAKPQAAQPVQQPPAQRPQERVPAPPANAGVPAPARPPVQPPAVQPARPVQPPPPRRRWSALVVTLLVLTLVAGGVYAATRASKSTPPQVVVTKTVGPSATSAPTHTPTLMPSPSATSTSTPTPTATTPPLYQADQLVPQNGDLPAGTTLTSSITSTTPADFAQNNPGRVVNPTSGFNWNKNIASTIDKGGSAYLFVTIDQFASANDAHNYYLQVIGHLASTKAFQVGDEGIEGQCCDNSPTSPNIFYREKNVTVLLVVSSDQQALLDGENLAKKLDQHVRPAGVTRAPFLTTLGPTWLSARSAAK
jgi:serine/threonine protein kinase